MNDLELQLVNSVQEAYTNAIQLVDRQNLISLTKDITATINVTELSVRRIITFFKHVPDFRDLSHKLSLKLLKQNMMNLLQVHGVTSFNRSEGTFKQPGTGDAPFTVESLEITYGAEISKVIVDTTNNLSDLCQENMILINILMLVVLFDPENDSLDADERILVESIENKYITLLYACICDRLGKSCAESTLNGIIFELSKIKSLSVLFKKAVAENSNHEKIQPLMQEVFSLNDTNTLTTEIEMNDLLKK